MRVEDFRALASLVETHSGLILSLDHSSALERALRDRLLANGLDSYARYVAFVRQHEDTELQELLDRVSNKETYFFREWEQVEAFARLALPDLLRDMSPTLPFSAWSAGCSTGEEVYSFAIALDASQQLQGRRVHVLGSDLSRSCVALARRGVYGSRSFRALCRDPYERYFTKLVDGTTVVPSVRQCCSFSQHNLASNQPPPVTEVDVILCRNVLIYFSNEMRRAVVSKLASHLRPGGILLLGHAESLLADPGPVQVVRHGDHVMYMRPRASSTWRLELESWTGAAR